MRIAATGAQSTGKTSAMKVAAEILGVPLMESASRTIFRERSLTEYDERSMSPEALWDLQKEIMELKVRNDSASDFLADRTLIDHLSYGLVWAWGGMSPEDLAWAEEVCREGMKRYDTVFYFPTGYIDLSSDGVRETSRAYQSLIDTLICGCLSRFGVSFYQVGPGSIEERGRWIAECVVDVKIQRFLF